MSVQLVINEKFTDIVREYDWSNADDVLECATWYGLEMYPEMVGEKAYFVGDQLFFAGIELEWAEVEY